MFFRIYYSQILIAVLVLVTIRCVRNYEPVISEIIAEPNPVEKGGTVSLTCIASDEDEDNDPNMRDPDSISYVWEAARGIILEDTSRENMAIWIAPEDTGKHSVTCSVSDINGGLDILSISVKVE